MKRSGILALWLILSLVSVVTSGCGYRVAATIQANAEAAPVPTKLSWAAVPGPALSASAPETLSGLQTVSVPLATALSLYNWKWLSNPDQAAEADVLVRIWWMTDGPQYITEWADPFYRPGLSFGTGIGFGSSPWHRGPFGYARQAFYVPEPSIQAIYSRVLVVEALRADALPKATLEALLPAAKPSGIASRIRACGEAGRRSLPRGRMRRRIALEGESPRQAPLCRPVEGDGSGSRSGAALCASAVGLRVAGRPERGRALARCGDERRVKGQYLRNPPSACHRCGAGRRQEHAGGRVRRQRHARDVREVSCCGKLEGGGDPSREGVPPPTNPPPSPPKIFDLIESLFTVFPVCQRKAGKGECSWRAEKRIEGRPAMLESIVSRAFFCDEGSIF